MAGNPSSSPDHGRLGEVIERHRAAILERLLTLPWADPSRPDALTADPDRVRERAGLFLDTLVSGLRTGDWRRFKETIGERTADLLARGVVSAPDLNQRALIMTTFLLPFVLAEPQPEALVTQLFAVMQLLSGDIVALHHERLLADSRRLDDLKTMFLRMTGHELRGPLGNIRGWASMLEAGDLGQLPAPAASGVRALDVAAAGALGMLDRLAEVARLESGEEALHRAPHKLAAVVTAAVAPLEEAAARRGIRVETTASGEASLDADEVAIAIRNLLGNAIKYANGSGVAQVRAWRQGPNAWFEVSDRGPGISPEDLEHVFERYYRSARSRSSGVGGSGLGLYIVRRIAELHGGEATVESTPGQGASFKLRIPSR